MRLIRWLVGVTLATLVLNCFCVVASAQLVHDIVSMKLLAPDVGWAASSGQLFWTNDGGQNWKDITPPTSPGTGISAVFFLDNSAGWVLLSRQADPDEEREFDLAATTNAGASWTVTPLQVPDPSPGSGLSGSAFIDFADMSHGWINVRVNQGSGPSHSFGVLLTTADGGKSWKRLRQPPAANSMVFHTPADGWLTEDGDLFATHDGGNSWLEVSLQAPAAAGPATSIQKYQLPVFDSAEHGFMPAFYDAPGGTFWSCVLFVTTDAGHSWKPAATLPNLQAQTLTVAGGTVLGPGISANHLLTLTKMTLVPGASLGSVTSVRADLTSLADIAYAQALSALDDSKSWVLANTLLRRAFAEMHGAVVEFRWGS